MSAIKTAIIYLDISAILMTATWVLFGVFRGLTLLELSYNYIYAVVVLVSLILNLVVIFNKQSGSI
jgi:hypothetical protein